MTIKETFTLDHLSVTLKVQGEHDDNPPIGGSYKVIYFDNDANVAETELLLNYDPNTIFTELESMADDWLQAELARENRLFGSANK